MFRRLSWLLLTTAMLAGCQAKPPQAVPCNSPQLGCEQAGVKVRFSTAPVVLTPFVLEVEAPGAKQVSASFSMLDMDMGENRYQLEPQRDGSSWRHMIILPVCIAGRSDWQLRLDVDGQPRIFTFSAAAR